MKEYHESILKYLYDGWQKNREVLPYYIFLRKNNQELKMALKTGNIVRGPYDILPLSRKK